MPAGFFPGLPKNQVIDFRLQMRQPVCGFGIGKIDVLIRARRNNVEFRIKYIYAGKHPVQTGQRIKCMAFILPHAVVIAGDFLVGTGDDEIGCVHGDQVSRKLGGKMIVVFVVLPI